MAIEDAVYFTVMVAIPAARRDLANRLFSELGEGTPFSVGLHRIGDDPATPTFYAALYARVKPRTRQFAMLRLANSNKSPDLSLFAEGTTQAEVNQVFGAIRCLYTWQEPDQPKVDARAYFQTKAEELGYAPVRSEPPAQAPNTQAAARVVRDWLTSDGGANAKVIRNRAGVAMRNAIVAAGGSLTQAHAKAGADAFMIGAFGITEDSL